VFLLLHHRHRIFATIYLTPLFLGEVRGFSALQIGLAIFTIGLFQVCAIPLYTRSAPDRSALPDDVWAGVLHAEHVEFHPDHA